MSRVLLTNRHTKSLKTLSGRFVKFNDKHYAICWRGCDRGRRINIALVLGVKILFQPTFCHDTIRSEKQLNKRASVQNRRTTMTAPSKMGDTRFANLKIRTAHKIVFGADFDECCWACCVFFNPLILQDWNDEMVVDWNGREKIAKKIFSLRVMVFIVLVFSASTCRSICDPSQNHTSCCSLRKSFNFSVRQGCSGRSQKWLNII